MAERDERLRFMSGFSGSHGVAVVTDSKAALWTDGRYLLQADNELGCDWLLMGRGEVHVSNSTDYREENCVSNSRIISYFPYFENNNGFVENLRIIFQTTFGTLFAIMGML